MKVTLVECSLMYVNLISSRTASLSSRPQHRDPKFCVRCYIADAMVILPTFVGLVHSSLLMAALLVSNSSQCSLLLRIVLWLELFGTYTLPTKWPTWLTGEYNSLTLFSQIKKTLWFYSAPEFPVGAGKGLILTDPHLCLAFCLAPPVFFILPWVSSEDILSTKQSLLTFVFRGSNLKCLTFNLTKQRWSSDLLLPVALLVEG